MTSPEAITPEPVESLIVRLNTARQEAPDEMSALDIARQTLALRGLRVKKPVTPRHEEDREGTVTRTTRRAVIGRRHLIEPSIYGELFEQPKES